MKIILIAVGNKMPSWVCEGFLEYQKRMPSDMRLQLVEIAPEKRVNKGSEEKSKLKESLAIENAIPKKAYVIVLDERGKQYTSIELSQKVSNWRSLGKDVVIIIGGPNGLTDALKNKADELISLSKLTLPHPLVRVFLAETLYRAYSIGQNLPYHRE